MKIKDVIVLCIFPYCAASFDLAHKKTTKFLNATKLSPLEVVCMRKFETATPAVKRRAPDSAERSSATTKLCR